MSQLNPKDFIITRKRKKYKFALFANSGLCLEYEQWPAELRPTVLEVGAGTGLFGAMLAAALPSEEIVAVDVKGDRLQTGARYAESQAMGNVHFIRARADLLYEKIAPHSVKQLWVTFPDPYPKKRSSGRRLTHPTFLRQYAKLLALDGALYFKTDAHDLFEWSLEQLVDEGWSLQELTFDLHESIMDDLYKNMTTYEKRFVSEGLKICFVKAVPPAR